MSWDSEVYRHVAEEWEGQWPNEEDQVEELTEEEQERLERSMAWHPSRGPLPQDRV
jgi:hypothetical protein